MKRNCRIFFVCLLLLPMVISCSKTNQKDDPIIALVDDNPVFLSELELMGRMAMGQDQMDFDSPKGQKRYKEIAPNLYESLLNIYIMKYGAQLENIQPPSDAIEAEYTKFVNHLKEGGQYDQYMKSFGLTEEKLRESVTDHLAIKELRKQLIEKFDFTPTEQDIKDYYHKNHIHFRFPKRMRVSHIFIQAPYTQSQEERDKAKIKAQAIHKMIGKNPAKTFAGIARQNSEDTVTAKRGGDLGFIDRNDPNLNKTFLDAAFLLQEGEVSDVIESEIGYHIIWATDHEQSLEEAKVYVERFLLQQKQADQLIQWLTETSKKLNVVRLFDPTTFEIFEPENTDTTAKES
jgi:parvulin-like peptidyl-prolyl isomerase